MSLKTLSIGRVKVQHVPDFILWADPLRLFPEVAAEEWDKYRDRPYVDDMRYLDEKGLMRVTLGSYLLSSDGKTVLVDTGIGGKDRRPRMNAGPGDLISNLASEGVTPDDIDIVVFTHLHIDHVGWNLTSDEDKLRPTFGRARYLVLKNEWEYWMDEAQLAEHENAFLRDTVAPLQDFPNLELVDHEIAITRDLTYMPLPGHTPGHTGFVIASDGEYGYIGGDATIHPVQVSEPGWWIFPDVDPQTGIQSRRKLLEVVAASGADFIAGHHVEPGFGRVVRNGAGYDWHSTTS
jgi:glyoxylase-like metal-dependent hydrolase (beta-lactamase superfamily II)